MEILAIILSIILAMIVGLQFYFLHKQNMELIKRVGRQEGEIPFVPPTAEEMVKNLIKDTDYVPAEEAPDDEFKKAAEKELGYSGNTEETV